MTSINNEAITLLPDEPTTAFEAAHSAVDQRLLAENTDIIRQEREAGTCTATLLPFLAWERSLHHWTGTNDALDRARTASSFEDHAGYGSPLALEAEMRIDLAYEDVTIREYFEVKGFEWPDFQVRVGVTPDGATPPAYTDVIASAIRRKNVRDWPGQVSYEVEESGPFAIGAVSVLNATINLLPLDPRPVNLAGVYFGVAGNLTGTINLRPY